MREYGRLHTRFWSSADIRHLSDDGKVFAAYLLTSPHSTLIGAFRLPDGYAADDLGWSVERVSKAFPELSRNGFASRDEGSKWVLIHRYLRWNPIENPNQAKAGAKIYDQIPDGSELKHWLYVAICELSPRLAAVVKPPRETVRKGFGQPFRNQEQEQEQKKAPSQEGLKGGGSAVREAGSPPGGRDGVVIPLDRGQA